MILTTFVMWLSLSGAFLAGMMLAASFARNKEHDAYLQGWRRGAAYQRELGTRCGCPEEVP